MQFMTLAVLLVATASRCSGETKSVEELIRLAHDAGAPFTTAALRMMRNTELWGAKRAGRSADIVIINESGTSFNALLHSCRLGSLSPGLLAEEYLGEHSSTVLGVESRKDDEYSYEDCVLSYTHGNGEYAFEIVLEGTITVRGDVYVKIKSSPGLKVTKDVSEGKNKQIIIQVSDDIEE